MTVEKIEAFLPKNIVKNTYQHKYENLYDAVLKWIIAWKYLDPMHQIGFKLQFLDTPKNLIKFCPSSQSIEVVIMINKIALWQNLALHRWYFRKVTFIKNVLALGDEDTYVIKQAVT